MPESCLNLKNGGASPFLSFFGLSVSTLWSPDLTEASKSIDKSLLSMEENNAYVKYILIDLNNTVANWRPLTWLISMHYILTSGIPYELLIQWTYTEWFPWAKLYSVEGLRWVRKDRPRVRRGQYLQRVHSGCICTFFRIFQKVSLR